MILHNFSTVSKVMFLFFFKPSKVLLSKPDFNKRFLQVLALIFFGLYRPYRSIFFIDAAI